MSIFESDRGLTLVTGVFPAVVTVVVSRPAPEHF